MASFKAVASMAFLLLSTATAHYNLVAPPSIGFDEKKEDQGPCGGFTPDFTKKDSVVDFHVGGEPVALKLGHPQANWLFRGTLDQTASGNWTQLFPIVQQSGLGLFCETAIPAPESWVGKQGVVGIVANAVDGLLYQCVAVNFVAGTGTVGSTCTNGTNIQGAFVPDTQLSALVGATSSNDTTPSSSTTSTSAAGSSPTSSSSPTSTPKGNAAAGLGPAVGGLMSAAALTLFGLALL